MSEQVFHPYTAWEDWQAGMWSCVTVTGHMEAAAQILGNCETFYVAASQMVKDWPRAAEHNLTDLGQNRRAWVGQAACCYLGGIPESATRLAWWLLTLEERDAANATADLVIAEWELARHLESNPPLFLLPEEKRSA